MAFRLRGTGRSAVRSAHCAQTRTFMFGLNSSRCERCLMLAEALLCGRHCHGLTHIPAAFQLLHHEGCQIGTPDLVRLLSETLSRCTSSGLPVTHPMSLAQRRKFLRVNRGAVAMQQLTPDVMVRYCNHHGYQRGTRVTRNGPTRSPELCGKTTRGRAGRRRSASLH